jgi:hypothetical protein
LLMAKKSRGFCPIMFSVASIRARSPEVSYFAPD